jgi:glycosyltransferase involved in cell wall biosynthesis
LKIGMFGTRGIPASYSGFETCVEQLGKRLVERGHQVTVYCRSHHIKHAEPTYLGMRLVRLPTIVNKYLDTFVHTLLSSIHALSQRYDIGLYFIAGNSPISWIPRLVGTKTILNVDGLDWRREKWPALAKRYIQFAEHLATKLPNLFLTDSGAIQDYYADRYGVRPPYIAYGSEVDERPAGELLETYGLQPNQYVLFVGRLVPENCVHHLIEAFRSVTTDMKCVIVGGSSYEDKYVERLQKLAQADSRIVMTGYVFGEGYQELGSNARIFVETSQVGGTHPALIEAMYLGNAVIVNDTSENLETIGEAGFSYQGGQGGQDLARVMQELIDSPALVDHYSSLARQRAQNTYSWERVTDRYEALCYHLVGGDLPDSLQSLDGFLSEIEP